MTRAFTLIELLVVVAIIGILAAVGVTTFGGFQEKAKVSATKNNHKTAVKKAALIISECGIDGSVQMMSKIRNTTKAPINSKPHCKNFSINNPLSMHQPMTQLHVHQRRAAREDGRRGARVHRRGGGEGD